MAHPVSQYMGVTSPEGVEQYCSGAEAASKAAFLVWTEAL